MELQEGSWFNVGRATFPTEGGIVRMWVRQEKLETSGTGTIKRDDYSPLVLEANAYNGTPTHQFPLQWTMTKVASAGEWSLYEAHTQVSGSYRFKVTYGTTSGGSSGVSSRSAPDPGTGSTTITETVHIDDVRLQPYASEMVCYVYDTQQKLVAVFDDQHFAQLYQYNPEGALVRKLKETRAGVKTISETHYNTVKVLR